MNSSIKTAFIIVMILLLIFLVGCRRTPTSSNAARENDMSGEKRVNDKVIPEDIDKSKIPTPDSPYVTIYVSKAGGITLDGKAASIEDVRSALAALAQKNGVVLYTRESPEEYEPHPIATKVIDLVIQNRLPIRMCVNRDFSDALDANGKLRIED